MTSAISYPRPTQPFILTGSINRVPTCPVGVKAGRSPLSGGRSHWQVASRSSEVNFTKNYTLYFLNWQYFQYVWISSVISLCCSNVFPQYCNYKYFNLHFSSSFKLQISVIHGTFVDLLISSYLLSSIFCWFLTMPDAKAIFCFFLSVLGVGVSSVTWRSHCNQSSVLGVE